MGMISNRWPIQLSRVHMHNLHPEARWPSGRASDSGARGRGSILPQVAVLFP